MDFIDPVIEGFPASRCIDIGHLWLEGHDPLPYLERWLSRTRVIHIHGIGSRDHQSLALQDPAEVASVLDLLDRGEYSGVLTLEVFGLQDFESSMAAVEKIGQRWGI